MTPEEILPSNPTINNKDYIKVSTAPVISSPGHIGIFTLLAINMTRIRFIFKKVNTKSPIHLELKQRRKRLQESRKVPNNLKCKLNQ